MAPAGAPDVLPDSLAVLVRGCGSFATALPRGGAGKAVGSGRQGLSLALFGGGDRQPQQPPEQPGFVERSGETVPDDEGPRDQVFIRLHVYLPERGAANRSTCSMRRGGYVSVTPRLRLGYSSTTTG